MSEQREKRKSLHIYTDTLHYARKMYWQLHSRAVYSRIIILRMVGVEKNSGTCTKKKIVFALVRFFFSSLYKIYVVLYFELSLYMSHMYFVFSLLIPIPTFSPLDFKHTHTYTHCDDKSHACYQSEKVT